MVSGQWSVVSGQWSVVSSQWSVARGVEDDEEGRRGEAPAAMLFLLTTDS